MAGTFRLVVARHKEDVGWLRQVPRPWHVSLVTKGVDVPNEGREASSYLYAMEKFYEDDGWLCFVQADPFDHFPPLMDMLKNGIMPHQFVPLGDGWAASDGSGGPWDKDLPVREYHEDLIGPWAGDVRFAPGAQFVMPAWIMRGRPKRELAELRERVNADPLGAHTMERLWWRFFVS